MKSTSIAALKSQLSKYLRAVRAGEPLAVTDRGRPIAMVIPIPSAPSGRLSFAAPTHPGRLQALKFPTVRLTKPIDPVALLLEERRKDRA